MNQPLKQGAALSPSRSGQAFRMKLYTQDRKAAVLDSFCKSFRRPGCCRKLLAQVIHRLMVGTVDCGTGAQKAL